MVENGEMTVLLLLDNAFIQIEEQARYRGIRRQFDHIQPVVDRGFPNRDELPRPVGVGGKMFQMPGQPVDENGKLVMSGNPRRRATKCKADTICRSFSPFTQNVLSKDARSFHIGRVVQQYQGLQWRVGS